MKDLRKAYKRRLLEWHPDKHKGEKKEEMRAKFDMLTEAYGVLSDPKKREMYDNDQYDFQNGESSCPQPEREVDLSQVLRMFFGDN